MIVVEPGLRNNARREDPVSGAPGEFAEHRGGTERLVWLVHLLGVEREGIVRRGSLEFLEFPDVVLQLLGHAPFPGGAVAHEQAAQGVLGSHPGDPFGRVVVLGLERFVAACPYDRGAKAHESRLAGRGDADDPSPHRRNHATADLIEHLVDSLLRVAGHDGVQGRPADMLACLRRRDDAHVDRALVHVVFDFVDDEASQHHVDRLSQHLLTHRGGVGHFLVGQDVSEQFLPDGLPPLILQPAQDLGQVLFRLDEGDHVRLAFGDSRGRGVGHGGVRGHVRADESDPAGKPDDRGPDFLDAGAAEVLDVLLDARVDRVLRGGGRDHVFLDGYLLRLLDVAWPAPDHRDEGAGRGHLGRRRRRGPPYHEHDAHTHKSFCTVHLVLLS